VEREGAESSQILAFQGGDNLNFFRRLVHLVRRPAYLSDDRTWAEPNEISRFYFLFAHRKKSQALPPVMPVAPATTDTAPPTLHHNGAAFPAPATIAVLQVATNPGLAPGRNGSDFYLLYGGLPRQFRQK
jgi:hypothetical protein